MIETLPIQASKFATSIRIECCRASTHLCPQGLVVGFNVKRDLFALLVCLPLSHSVLA